MGARRRCGDSMTLIMDVFYQTIAQVCCQAHYQGRRGPG